MWGWCLIRLQSYVGLEYRDEEYNTGSFCMWAWSPDTPTVLCIMGIKLDKYVHKKRSVDFIFTIIKIKEELKKSEKQR